MKGTFKQVFDHLLHDLHRFHGFLICGTAAPWILHSLRSPRGDVFRVVLHELARGALSADCRSYELVPCFNTTFAIMGTTDLKFSPRDSSRPLPISFRSTVKVTMKIDTAP
jgi:hypothetical protein